MKYRRSAYVLGSLIAGCLALVLAGGAFVLMRYPLGTIELNAARQRWATRSFSHYHLALEYGETGYCRQIIDVKERRVVALLQNTCSKPAPTVDELFDRIEQDMLRLDGRCGTNGCGCDGTFVVTATYDPQLGYPHLKRVRLNAGARLWFPDYWQRQLSGTYCSNRRVGYDNVTILSLTPIG